MRRWAPVVVGTIAVGLSACLIRTSPAPDKFSPAIESLGSSGEVLLLDGSMRGGELLAVTDSTIHLLSARRVSVAFYRDLVSFDFRDFSWQKANDGPVPDTLTVARGRGASRFPFGLTAPALKALLDRSAQTAPDTVRPRR